MRYLLAVSILLLIGCGGTVQLDKTSSSKPIIDIEKIVAEPITVVKTYKRFVPIEAIKIRHWVAKHKWEDKLAYAVCVGGSEMIVRNNPGYGDEDEVIKCEVLSNGLVLVKTNSGLLYEYHPKKEIILLKHNEDDEKGIVFISAYKNQKETKWTW